MTATLAVTTVAACTSAPPAPEAPQVKGVEGSAEPRIVVAITVDGMKSSTVSDLGREQLPALHRMIRQGGSTLNARTAVEKTVTMPNHAGVFTGRRVLGTFGHQVTFNDDVAATDVHTVAGRYVPSMFDVVHDHGGKVRFFTGKSKFAFFNRSWDAQRGAQDEVGADDGRDKIDAYVYRQSAKELVDRVVSSLKRRPATLTYLHLRLPDSAGHAHGWASQEYDAAVRKSSAQVGRILRLIAGRDSLRSRTAVVLTADHGGEGRGHGNSALPINYTVPFLVWGQGIARGADLYDLNPERVDPGTASPDYFDGRPPVRNLDLASLVTTYLGLGKVPGGTAPHTEPLKAW